MYSSNLNISLKMSCSVLEDTFYRKKPQGQEVTFAELAHATLNPIKFFSANDQIKW